MEDCIQKMVDLNINLDDFRNFNSLDRDVKINGTVSTYYLNLRKKLIQDVYKIIEKLENISKQKYIGNL